MAAAKFPIELRAVGLDDIAEIRALHKSSFRTFAHTGYSDLDIEQFETAVDSAAYADAVLSASPVAAFFDGTMVGSAGWLADGAVGSRRISHVFVRPMFTRRGIGSALVKTCESPGAEAGERRFEVRATHNAVEFFEHLGYEVTGYGVSKLAGALSTIGVTFMRKGPKLPTGVVRSAAVLKQTAAAPVPAEQLSAGPAARAKVRVGPSVAPKRPDKY